MDYINQQLESLVESVPSCYKSSLEVYLTETSFGDDCNEAESLIILLCSMLSSCAIDFQDMADVSSSDQVNNNCSRLKELSHRLFYLN